MRLSIQLAEHKKTVVGCYTGAGAAGAGAIIAAASIIAWPVLAALAVSLAVFATAKLLKRATPMQANPAAKLEEKVADTAAEFLSKSSDRLSEKEAEGIQDLANSSNGSVESVESIDEKSDVDIKDEIETTVRDLVDQLDELIPMKITLSYYNLMKLGFDDFKTQIEQLPKEPMSPEIEQIAEKLCELGSRPVAAGVKERLEVGVKDKIGRMRLTLSMLYEKNEKMQKLLSASSKMLTFTDVDYHGIWKPSRLFVSTRKALIT